jgi:hypothetical protein
MSSMSHNKKRNCGLLYAFLVRTISQALVEGNQKKSATALKILRRYFKPGTELYKEFRLINALFKTTVSSEAVAASILSEAKTAARSYNLAALDREKSLLIKQINYSLNDDDFYDQQINEYRMYATIQTLLNDWRSVNSDLGRMASYEDQLMQWLINPKPEAEEHMLSEESTGTARLLMKVMTKKLNEKYAGVLNEEQRSLVKAYVFAMANDDPNTIKNKMAEIKDGLLSRIEEYSAESPDNKYINDKLQDARARLLTENLETIDDDTVTRFMLYTKLHTELNSEEG